MGAFDEKKTEAKNLVQVPLMYEVAESQSYILLNITLYRHTVLLVDVFHFIYPTRYWNLKLILYN